MGVSSGSWLKEVPSLPSVNEDEFVGIQQETAGRGESTFLRIGDESSAFVGRGEATEGELAGRFDLFLRDGAEGLQAFGKDFRLPEHEGIVEEGQGLEGGQGGVADGGVD